MKTWQIMIGLQALSIIISSIVVAAFMRHGDFVDDEHNDGSNDL